MPATPTTPQEAHARVKKLLSERGITFTQIAEDIGVEITALLRASACQTSVTKSTVKYRQAIAKAIGVPAGSIWPAKYLDAPDRVTRNTAKKTPDVDTKRRVLAALGDLGLTILAMSQRYDIPASSLNMAISGMGRQDHIRRMVADIIRIPERELWPEIFSRDAESDADDGVLRIPSIYTDDELNAVMGLPAPPEAMKSVFSRMPPVEDDESA